MEQETQELRKAGLKVTHPRMRILQIFEEDGVRHLTAEDVYKKLLAHQEDIGLATVYGYLPNSKPPASSVSTISRVGRRSMSWIVVNIMTT